MRLSQKFGVSRWAACCLAGLFPFSAALAATIVYIPSGSVAEKRGLKVGDVIQSVHLRETAVASDVERVVSERQLNGAEVILVKVERRGFLSLPLNELNSLVSLPKNASNAQLCVSDQHNTTTCAAPQEAPLEKPSSAHSAAVSLLKPDASEQTAMPTSPAWGFLFDLAGTYWLMENKHGRHLWRFEWRNPGQNMVVYQISRNPQYIAGWMRSANALSLERSPTTEFVAARDQTGQLDQNGRAAPELILTQQEDGSILMRADAWGSKLGMVLRFNRPNNLSLQTAKFRDGTWKPYRRTAAIGRQISQREYAAMHEVEVAAIRAKTAKRSSNNGGLFGAFMQAVDAVAATTGQSDNPLIGSGAITSYDGEVENPLDPRSRAYRENEESMRRIQRNARRGGAEIGSATDVARADIDYTVGAGPATQASNNPASAEKGPLRFFLHAASDGLSTNMCFSNIISIPWRDNAALLALARSMADEFMAKCIAYASPGASPNASEWHVVSNDGEDVDARYESAKSWARGLSVGGTNQNPIVRIIQM